MMSYLSEAEGNVAGNDLKYIREMIGYSGQQYATHNSGYEKIKKQILEMGDQAVNSFKNDKGAEKIVESATAETNKLR